MTYQGNLNFNGSDTLTVLSADSAGAPLSDTDTIAITVVSINDAPVNTLPGPHTVQEGAPLALPGVSVNDVDGNLATTQLSVNNGTLTVDLAGGATVSAGANGSDTLTLSGTQAQINSALATLIYQGNATYNGIETLTMVSTDSAGTPLSDIDTLAIVVTPINDAPINTVPGAQTLNEDAALAIGGISVGDPDGNLATTQLSVGSGSLAVDLAGGATLSAGANGSATLTLAGTQTQINAALATLRYQGNLNFNGSDTLTMLSTDSAGTPLSDTDTIALTVNPVNDAPVAGDDSYNMQSGATLTLDLLANDSDTEGQPLRIVSISGVLLTGGAQSIAVPNGTVNIDAAGVMHFTPAAGYDGPVAFGYMVADASGATDTAAVGIRVEAPIGGPTNLPPNAADDTANTLPSGNAVGNVLGNDGDPDGDPLSVTQITVDSDGDGTPETYPVPPGGSTSVNLTTADGTPIGTLTMGSNGEFMLVPAPGYQGTVPDVDVTVSDGEASDSSSLRFGTVGVAPVPPQPPAGPAPGPWTDNTPPAANGGTAAGPTGSENVSAPGAVLGAVNDAASLSGTTALDGNGAVLAAVNGAQSLFGTQESTRQALEGKGFTQGWNPLASTTGLSGDINFVRSLGTARSPDGSTALQLLADRERVWLDANDLRDDPRQRIVRTQVAMADGSALPGWVRTDGQNRVFMDRPAGADRVSLRITVQRADGSNASYVVDVDLNNTLMRVRTAVGADRRADTSGLREPGAPLNFLAQLQRGASRAPSADVDQELIDALG